jgi:hypothetical protein
MVTPLNDWLKIELEDAGPLSARAGDIATSGILVEVPEFTHYGYYSFAFENSLMNDDILEQLIEHWQSLKGKRLYWLALSEKGAILKEEAGKRFAFVKPTSIMGWSEPEEVADSILDNKGGAFAA